MGNLLFSGKGTNVLKRVNLLSFFNSIKKGDAGNFRNYFGVKRYNFFVEAFFSTTTTSTVE